jgi:hypothetical protein
MRAYDQRIILWFIMDFPSSFFLGFRVTSPNINDCRGEGRLYTVRIKMRELFWLLKQEGVIHILLSALKVFPQNQPFCLIYSMMHGSF